MVHNYHTAVCSAAVVGWGCISYEATPQLVIMDTNLQLIDDQRLQLDQFCSDRIPELGAQSSCRPLWEAMCCLWQRQRTSL